MPDDARTDQPHATAAPPLLWRPSPDRVERSDLTAFCRGLPASLGIAVGDYDALWQWSVDELEQFWAAVWRHYDVAPGTSYDTVLAERRMPGAQWFPGARLNFTDHVLRHVAERLDDDAVVGSDESGPTRTLSWRALEDEVLRVCAALRGLGVSAGDRVVAYLPNAPEAVVAFLAVARLGAVWSACAPDVAARSAHDRFGQLEPVVLLAADGYRFGGKQHDRRAAAEELAAALPTVRTVVHVPVLGLPQQPGGLSWDDLLAADPDPSPAEQLPFDAPLWVVFSSGTTGLPKGLVHGHGGVLLTALSQVGLLADVRPGDRACWYTSTSWVMWNALVMRLLVGASVLVHDGSPLHPTPDALWELAERHRLTSLGVSPGYLLACSKAGLEPGRDHDLSALRSLGVTGSPLPATSYEWVYRSVAQDLDLNVISGGTDFAAALVGGAPWLPVWAGEMSGRALGCHVESWDEAGRPLRDEVGELVVLAPLPSMPLQVWGDDDGSRMAASYFDVYPGVWRHGDWLTLTSRGSAVVSGRSDATLNRHGVRMGSSDVYQAVEQLPEVVEALVVGVEQEDGGYWLPLFVRLPEGRELDDDLVRRIRDTVRTGASPRHVPDEVLQVAAVPHTATGKKLEVPVKRVLQGTPPEKACNLGAVDDPQAVLWFAELAERRRAQRASTAGDG